MCSFKAGWIGVMLAGEWVGVCQVSRIWCLRES